MKKMKMRRLFYILIIPAITFIIYSCSTSENKMSSAVDKIQQKEDGTLELQIEKADCYNDVTNPTSNTAEWNVVVSKSGRYKVWVSSATLDTMDLQYNNSVIISIQDDRIDARPKRDRIVQNAGNIKYPYYRADSYIGTFYIQEPGEYTIQVISDKVIAQTNNNSDVSETIHTKLMSVFLTPVVR
jgi:hypothetical protein